MCQPLVCPVTFCRDLLDSVSIIGVVFICLSKHLKTITVISVYITKTCLYNFDPHKPHFYIVKLGFTGAYIIFLIFAKNIDCGYSLEPPRQSMF